MEASADSTAAEFDVADSRTTRDVLRAALDGRLPLRYDDFWLGPYRRELAALLRANVRILDVGAGAEPTLAPAERPEGTHYVGLDISREELERAPRGSYDDTVVADLTHAVPALRDSFDVVLSFQVLEHVKPLDRAIENMREYLRPGGTMVSRLSGGASIPALLNRAVPHRLAVWLESTLRGRDPASVFPARYDRCTYSGLSAMLSGWSQATVIPQYTGALYFRFLRPLQAVYLAFEEWVVRSDRRDLAVYYVLRATR